MLLPFFDTRTLSIDALLVTMRNASAECMRMNTGRVLAHSGQYKQEINTKITII